MPKDLSIIIVNYNSGAMLSDCLQSIRRELSIDYEVIVIDNGSTDDSIALCATLKKDSRFIFHETGENVGFAAGCNAGAALSSGRVLHFLNPDTELRPGINNDFLQVLSDPEKVYVTPLVNRDGSIENGKMVLPLLRDIFWWNTIRSKARFWCKGASVIISRENFSKVGRWCEDYFMYGEDLDLFYQFWNNKLQIHTLPTPIFHYGGGCSQNVWNSFEREVKVQRSLRLFFIKHRSTFEYIAVKCYFLFHNLIKHPSKVKGDIKAWNKV
jgi:GT2 family glycosyltransferase